MKITLYDEKKVPLRVIDNVSSVEHDRSKKEKLWIKVYTRRPNCSKTQVEEVLAISYMLD